MAVPAVPAAMVWPSPLPNFATVARFSILRATATSSSRPRSFLVWSRCSASHRAAAVRRVTLAAAVVDHRATANLAVALDVAVLVVLTEVVMEVTGSAILAVPAVSMTASVCRAVPMSVRKVVAALAVDLVRPARTVALPRAVMVKVMACESQRSTTTARVPVLPREMKVPARREVISQLLESLLLPNQVPLLESLLCHTMHASAQHGLPVKLSPFCFCTLVANASVKNILSRLCEETAFFIGTFLHDGMHL